MRTLQETDLEHFEEHGYVVVEGLLDPDEDLQPVEEEYSALLDSLAEQSYSEGKLSSAYRGLPFGRKLSNIAAEGFPYNQYMDIMVSKNSPMHHGPAVFNLLRNPKLMDAVERFIGPEIYSNPIQHVRIKPPERLLHEHMMGSNTARSEWHQDQGVTTEEADDTDLLTVWLPITEATEENGCLVVDPGSHRGDLLLHCPATKQNQKTRAYVPDQLIGNQVALPMHPGDVLFLHKKTVHGSLSNVSDGIRWSYDLRYNPIGQPTGRDWLPGFVARSHAHPDTELTDPVAWAQLWEEAHKRLLNGQMPAKADRWKDAAGNPLCA